MILAYINALNPPSTGLKTVQPGSQDRASSIFRSVYHFLFPRKLDLAKIIGKYLFKESGSIRFKVFVFFNTHPYGA